MIESIYGMRGVIIVISISLNYVFVFLCVFVVSGDFSLDGKYVWDAGCNNSDQHQPELHVCVYMCVCVVSGEFSLDGKYM